MFTGSEAAQDLGRTHPQFYGPRCEYWTPLQAHIDHAKLIRFKSVSSKSLISMFAKEPSTLDTLLRMTRGFTSNPVLRQDLLQEALIHLWLMETRRPEQTKSWYLQSCKFHLHHYLASGRSVDSAKRAHDRTGSEGNFDEEDPMSALADAGPSLVSRVSARDLISVLSSYLSPRETDVLHCLADGLGPREIGRRLEMSHSMARKHRSKIASLLRQLEASPRTQLANGVQPLPGEL